jgi:hypothetical protein
MEGNDPQQSGESIGTPSDMQTGYGQQQEPQQDDDSVAGSMFNPFDDGEDERPEDEQGGRPKEMNKPFKDSGARGRDPLGKQTKNRRPLALAHYDALKKTMGIKKSKDIINETNKVDELEKEYDEYKKLTVKEAGPYISKFIKEWFDWQNKWLVKNKSKIKKNLINPEDKPSAWWNEILIYNPKIIDVFVMERITRDGYWMQQWGDNKPGPWQKEILKYVPKNKITIGTPAKFRKWYKDREGIIDQV